MIRKWVTIQKGNDGDFAGYLALPPSGRGPGLLLLQEIFGVNQHIRAVAEQYAMAGFVVLAPDMFWRLESRVELGYGEGDRQEAYRLLQAADLELLVVDSLAATGYLRQIDEVTGKVGALGFCLGGRLAYLAAATTQLDAASCYYGGGIHQHLERVAAISCPVQFHYGAADAAIPRTEVDLVRAAFAGRDSEFHLYDGAGHGFNYWERDAYQARSACKALGSTLNFFADRLFG